MHHNKHIALIDKDILNDDINNISDIFYEILSVFGRTSGPFNDGKSGIYIDQEGYDNIDKLIEKYGCDRNIDLNILYALREIQKCDGNVGSKDFQAPCGGHDCLPLDKITNYESCPNSKIFITQNSPVHKCRFVEIYPTNFYKFNYGYRYMFLENNKYSLKTILSSEFNNLFNNLVISEFCLDSNIYNSDGSKEDIKRIVFRHLCVLDDFAIDIWSKYKLSNLKQAELGSHGVAASLESPNIHKNRKSMERRKFCIKHDDKYYTVTCEWHTKIHATSGRIYFYVHEELQKVFIGKICRHL